MGGGSGMAEFEARHVHACVHKSLQHLWAAAGRPDSGRDLRLCVYMCV